MQNVYFNIEITLKNMRKLINMNQGHRNITEGGWINGSLYFRVGY